MKIRRLNLSSSLQDGLHGSGSRVCSINHDREVEKEKEKEEKQKDKRLGKLDSKWKTYKKKKQ